MKTKLIFRGFGKIFFAIFAYGIFASLFYAALWPDEGIQIIFNIPGVLLGDQIHTSSVELFGNPTSSDAFYTVPWIVRQPYVYLLSSIIFWGLLGIGIQRLVNLLRN